MADASTLLRMRPALLAIFVALALFAVAACGGDDDDQQAATTVETIVEPEEPTPVPEEVPPEPEPEPAPEPAPEPPAEPALAAEQVLRVAILEPLSIDPANAVEFVGANVLLNIMDGLVKLDPETLQAGPNIAERWDVSADDSVITFHLRSDGQWTNGDPLTADDFVFSWLRVLNPEVAASNAFHLWDIAGAFEYNSCDPAGAECDALGDEVGIRAIDDQTLEVTLVSGQPWFLERVAHQAFLPVHPPTVEEFGDGWTEPENIVTSGPFQLTEWDHDASLTLEKWDDWRDADSVQLTTIEGPMIAEPITGLQAFEANEIDACFPGLCQPGPEVERLRETPEWLQVPALSTTYFGLNLETVTDPNQRRAMGFAFDRRVLIDEVLTTGEPAATSFVPDGMPGFDVIQQDFLPATADLDQAAEFMSQASEPKTTINFVYPPEDPAGEAFAVATQAAWSEIGIETEIRAVEFQSLLALLGPPLDSSVDAYLLTFPADFPDATTFLEIWACDSGTNFSNFCSPAYDETLTASSTVVDDDERFELYSELEAMLTGADGGLPILPIAWLTNVMLRKIDVQNFAPNALIQFDFTETFIAAE